MKNPEFYPINAVIRLLALLFFIPLLPGQRPELEMTEIRGHTMYTLLNPGDIPAIFNPEYIDVHKAASKYYPSEPLIVVPGINQSKGYSTWHLDEHEVVNDYIDGTAIAVTW